MQLLLDEETGSAFLDEKTTYDFLNEGALEVARNTNTLTAEQSITTVADQVGYSLNANFLKMYLKDNGGDFFIHYSDGTTTFAFKFATYEDIIFQDDTTSVSIPSRFTITDDPTLDTQITGTTTSAGSLSSTTKEATLTDTAADFSDVSAGDIVHNTTDSASGIMLSKTSSTVLVTAMFPDDPSASVDQDWDSSDAYVIQPQGRLRIVLDPPPSTAGHTVTVYYVTKPLPVYANFRTFRFPQHLNLATVKYAAWLYKYKDREPNFGDKLFTMADNEMRRGKSGMDKAFNRTKIRVNMMARR
jgi:hypothetical protein